MRTTSLVHVGLLALLSGLLVATPGCKKSGETNVPDEQAEDDDDGTNDGDDAEDADDAAEGADESDAAGDDATPLTTSSFEETVNNHMEDVASCYGDAVAANAELQGTLDGVFTIAADGTVAEFKAAEGSSLNDEGLNACITEKTKDWVFDKPAGGENMTLNFPFNLTPG